MLQNKRYELVNVHFGRCGNQVSAGTMEKFWLTRTKTRRREAVHKRNITAEVRQFINGKSHQPQSGAQPGFF